MAWRVLLIVFYALVSGALIALENYHPSMSGAPILLAWLAALVVGFLVGRWWVLLAVVGVLVGHTIGWDPAENDGNPALWPPYVVATIVSVGLPLLIGVGCSYLRRTRASASGVY